MKKLFSMVLSLMMGLSVFSVAAFASSTQRTSTLTLSAAASGSSAAEGWSWDHESLTLTLSGIDFDILSGTGIILPDGGDEVVTVVLQGENTISTINANCIYAGGKLKIQGSGSLTSASGSGAIYATGDIEIAGGTLSLSFSGGAGVLSNEAIVISGGNITCGGNNGMGDGGIGGVTGVTVTGGSIMVTGMARYGIGSDYAVEISGGSITVDNCARGIWSAFSVGITITGGYTAITNAVTGYLVGGTITVSPNLLYDESEAGLFIRTPASTDRTFAAERAEETEAWQQLRDEAADSADNATISFDAKFYDTVPCWFVDALAGKPVTLNLTWRDENGVKQTAAIDCSNIHKTDSNRVFFTISDFAQRYA